MMGFKEIGGNSGISVATMLVKNAVDKNRELKELLDKPTQSKVDEKNFDDKLDTKVEELSSQDSSNTLKLKTDQPTGRAVDVEV